jgi:2-dehydro-3-deoxyphosphogluconate aldolase/(4S)-4-hydroxy-2-oxoglutarate aldolase
MTRPDVLARIAAGRVLAVVRTQELPDASALCGALARGGIGAVELTFTTPDLLIHLTRAAETREATGAVVGAGTVLTARHARTAVDAGAQFLVTPGIGPDAAEIVRIAHDADVPVVLGALTPSEVMTAVSLGADAVKIFPAHRFGPSYLKDLRGPFPDTLLVPSGGITADNAQAFLDAGGLVVCAGSNVVSPADVASAAWDVITDRAAAFCAALH